MEVTAIRQQLEHGFIYTGRVNSDRPMADGLTKPHATCGNCLRSCLLGDGKLCGLQLSRVVEGQVGATVIKQKIFRR